MRTVKLVLGLEIATGSFFVKGNVAEKLTFLFQIVRS